MIDDTKLYAPIIKSLSYTLNQFRLYSLNHPIAKDSIRKLSEEMQKFFIFKEKLVIGTMKNVIVVEGKVFDEKDPAAVDLAKAFQRVGIEAVHFDKGIEQMEISTFLLLLGTRPKDLEAKGGFKKALEANHFDHVKLSTAKFQLVEEGQVVSNLDSGGLSVEPSKDAVLPAETSPSAVLTAAPPARFTSVSDIISKIRSDQKAGTSKREPIPIDAEKIVIQLEKNPEQIAQLAIQETKDPAHLEGVIRNIVNYLVDGLLSFLVEQGKDLTKALERLAAELEKSVNKSLAQDQADKLNKKIPQIFEETLDELRVQMVIKTYQKNQNDPKPVEKIVKKIFKDKAVRERLLPSVRDELVQAGFKTERFDAIFEGMEARAEKKKRSVSIDASELAELKQKADLFDQGGGKGGGGGPLVQEVETLKKERKKLLDEKERVDSVIRNLGEGLLVVDKQGKVVLMNPAAEKLLGVKQTEKVGKKVTDDLKEEHLVAMTQGDLRHKEGPTAKNVEIVSLNDETKRVLQASTAIIENEDGETVGMVSVLSDVTKQKEVEKLKNQFVSNVSHELRTPLVAIQKSLSLILGKEVGEISPEQEKFLAIAHRNIDRLSRLINDLLDVAKLEEGRMVLRPKKVPVQELVLHVLSTMETWIKDKEIKTETLFPAETVELEIDPDKITQVVTNLLGNAVKFTPSGGKITIDIRKVEDPQVGGGQCVEIGIQDTGIGIAEEDQDKIFDKFVQVSLVQPQGVSSTGLGLTIVKEIVGLHSGRVLLTSETGKGSRFYFRLPLAFQLKEEKKSRL